MNKNIHFYVIFVFAAGMDQYNFALSEDAKPATAQRLSLRESLQGKWNEKLANLEAHRKDSCRSIFFGLAALQDMEAFLKVNNITEVFWRNQSKFADVEFWFNTPYGSVILDSPDLKELLKEAVKRYDGNTDRVQFDKQQYAIDSSEDIFSAPIMDLLAKRRKALESGLEKLRCSEFETQTNGN